MLYNAVVISESIQKCHKSKTQEVAVIVVNVMDSVI